MKEWDVRIVRYLAGEGTREDNKQLEEWVRSDVRHRQYFDSFKKLWELGGIDVDNFNPDRQLALQNMLKRIHNEKPSDERKLIHNLFYYAKRMAAILIVGLGIGVAVYFIYQQTGVDAPRVLTSSAQMKHVVLRDGTSVWLNEHSSVRYPEKFTGSFRRVHLDGEAYFEVAKNPEKPFIIDAGNSLTQVVGTSFNIRSMADENETVITVTSGKVKFRERSGHQEVYLEKGDKGILKEDPAGVVKEKNSDVNFLSWKTGKLVFSNTPLDEAAKAIARHYHTTIVVHGNVARCAFTSEFNNQRLDDVLEELQILLNIQIKRQNSRIILEGNGC